MAVSHKRPPFFINLSVEIKKVKKYQKKFQKTIDKPKLMVYNNGVVARQTNARVAELADAHV